MTTFRTHESYKLTWPTYLPAWPTYLTNLPDLPTLFRNSCEVLSSGQTLLRLIIPVLWIYDLLNPLIVYNFLRYFIICILKDLIWEWNFDFKGKTESQRNCVDRQGFEISDVKILKSENVVKIQIRKNMLVKKLSNTIEHTTKYFGGKI